MSQPKDSEGISDVNKSGFGMWRDRIGVAAILGAAASAVSFGGWLALGLMERPTREETAQMIQTQAPYIEDRKLIEQQLEESSRIYDRLADVLQRNTEAINDLKVAVGKMSDRD